MTVREIKIDAMKPYSTDHFLYIKYLKLNSYKFPLKQFNILSK